MYFWMLCSRWQVCSKRRLNDDILLTGAEYFAELVKQRMPK